MSEWGRVVYKYSLTGYDGTDVAMPIGAQILKVDFQSPSLDVRLWALVDPSAQKEIRRFVVWPTGRYVPDGRCEHIGSFGFNSNEVVFHCFEVTEDHR